MADSTNGIWLLGNRYNAYSYTATENGSATLIFTRTGDDVSAAASFSWRFTGVAASDEDAGAEQLQAADFPDGIVPSGTVTFQPGERTTELTIRLGDDRLHDSGEFAQVLFENPVNALFASGSTLQPTYSTTFSSFLNVIDDDLPLNQRADNAFEGAVRYLGTADDALFGTPNDDNLHGGAGNDEIHGGGSFDLLIGDDGRDTLIGDDGADQIFGGEGEDTVYAGSGHDEANGGDGNDYLTGWLGDDWLAGDNGEDLLAGEGGNDTMFGGAGTDTLHGGSGNDYLGGQDGDDRLSGNDGNDQMEGHSGADQLFGDSGNDMLYGRDGADLLDGGDGDDLLDGGDGDDRLSAGAGNDTLYGFENNDTLDGGEGSDRAVMSYSSTAWQMSRTSGGWTAVRGNETDELTGIERVTFDDGVFTLDPVGDGPGLGMDFSQLRDFDGNDLGGAGSWTLQGIADIDGNGRSEYVLTNTSNGRWATATSSGGTVDFSAHGADGTTRVVGVYSDPLVTAGLVTAGSEFDSAQRFANDLRADRLMFLGTGDYDADGRREVFWKIRDGNADPADDVYLRALMHTDVNIDYANYRNVTQFSDYMTTYGVSADIWSGWLTRT